MKEADNKDDASVLSIPAMRRWNRILRIFTAEYLGLVLDGVNVEKRITHLDDELVCESGTIQAELIAVAVRNIERCSVDECCSNQQK